MNYLQHLFNDQLYEGKLPPGVQSLYDDNLHVPMKSSQPQTSVTSALENFNLMRESGDGDEPYMESWTERVLFVVLLSV